MAEPAVAAFLPIFWPSHRVSRDLALGFPPGLNRAPWNTAHKVYVVLAVPGELREIQGLHAGPNAWNGIRESIPGGRYRSGEDHLFHRSSWPAAWAAYRSEHHQRGAPRLLRAFWWP